MNQSGLLLSSNYLPCIEYLHSCSAANSIIIEGHENYLKGSYSNRTHIVSAAGLLRLSIPLEKGKNQKQRMKDVRISYTENWQRIHWQSLCSSYNHSPYFQFYKDDIEAFYSTKPDFLIDWNTQLLQWLIAAFKLNVTINFTSDYTKDYPPTINDKRNGFSPKINNTNPIIYPQVFESAAGFIPNLSSIDLLFNAGAENLPKK